MSGIVDVLVEEIRQALADHADPDKSEPMRAYMKSAMPFLGVTAGPRRQVCREIFKTRRLPDAGSWMLAVTTLWREARYREERYAAIQLSGLKRYDVFRTPDCLPLLEEIIVSGAWWDYVDEVAVRQIGWMLEKYPEHLMPLLLSWCTDDDMWKRRTAITCQVLRKERTDPMLLARAIIPSVQSREFFLRKAIGWSLRAYGMVDASFVRSFVATHASQLSGLSRREALRRIGEE